MAVAFCVCFCVEGFELYGALSVWVWRSDSLTLPQPGPRTTTLGRAALHDA